MRQNYDDSDTDDAVHREARSRQLSSQVKVKMGLHSRKLTETWVFSCESRECEEVKRVIARGINLFHWTAK